MTEREWQDCADPGPMMTFLGDRLSRRKVRLFAAACCRRVWYLLTDEPSRGAVEAVERHAAGLARKEEVCAARAEAMRCREVRPPRGPRQAALSLARRAVVGRPERAPALLARAVGLAQATAARRRSRARLVGDWASQLSRVPAGLAPAVWQALSVPALGAVRAEEALALKVRRAREDHERRRQAELLREVVGNPFRPAVIDPAWLAWGGGVVANLARAVLRDGDFDALPVLADALEEAGCADPDILAHCRGPGPHVPGCWVIDLILGRR